MEYMRRYKRNLNEVKSLKTIIDQLIEEDNTLSRLYSFVTCLHPELLEKLADYILSRIQLLLDFSTLPPDAFQNIQMGRCSDIREVLAIQFIWKKQWSKAAQILGGIVLNYSDHDELIRYVQIANLYLKDNDAVNAEAFINRASGLVQNYSSELVFLCYLDCNARILDLKRNFLEAASGYYKISQFPLQEIEDASQEIEDANFTEEKLLTAAVTCTILADAGHTRDRLLTTLYMDERCSKLKIYPILHKMYLRGKLTKRDIYAFAKHLESHQVTQLMKKEIPRPSLSSLGLFFVISVIISYAAVLASHGGGGGDVPSAKKGSFASAVTGGFQFSAEELKRIEENSQERVNYPGLVSADKERKSKGSQLVYATLCLTWPRSFILLKQKSNWMNYIHHVPNDMFVLHGLWPPEERKAKGISFNKNKVFADRSLYDRARKYWPNLSPNDGLQYDDHQARFWGYEWMAHGDKSGMLQEDYMNCALELYELVHKFLYKAVEENAEAYFDHVLQLHTWRINIVVLERALRTAFNVNLQLVCVTLGNGKTILSSVHFNVSMGPPHTIVGMKEPSSCHGNVILT